MVYSKSMSASEPGLVILLLDHSKSMDEPFGTTEKTKKADSLAENVNKVLAEMCLRNTKDVEGKPVVKPRIDISIIGYGSNQEEDDEKAITFPLDKLFPSKEYVSIKDLASKYIRLDTIKKGGQSATQKMPIWIEPTAVGWTPMGTALMRSGAIASTWTSKHKTSFPPIVLNFTDGDATDYEDSSLKRITEQLKHIKTDDGNVLLFNCHITSGSTKPCLFPSAIDQVPNDPLAKLLFDISSVLPLKMQTLATGRGFSFLNENSRGYVFNADITNLVHFMQIGTIGATSPAR